jgi:hypothetical protein
MIPICTNDDTYLCDAISRFSRTTPNVPNRGSYFQEDKWKASVCICSSITPILHFLSSFSAAFHQPNVCC